MSILIGYRVPGDSRGRCLTLGDEFHKLVSDEDASRIAAGLRQSLGREPAPQSVRGRLIQLAKTRRGGAS